MTVDPSPLSFGAHDDVVFARSPLSLVICQIRFDAITSLLTEVGIVGFQEALRALYPQFNREEEAEIGISDTTTSVRRRVPIWRLTDESGVWQTSIAVDFLSLETQNYAEFTDFLNRLGPIVDALDRTVHPSKTRRLGLRFINEFSFSKSKNVTEWSEILRNSLLGLIADRDLANVVTSSRSEIRLADANGDSLVVRHGVPQEDSSKYVLDMDYFTTAAYPIEPESDLFTALLGFSRSMTGVFHRYLTERGIEYLEPSPRETRE